MFSVTLTSVPASRGCYWPMRERQWSFREHSTASLVGHSGSDASGCDSWGLGKSRTQQVQQVYRRRNQQRLSAYHRRYQQANASALQVKRALYKTHRKDHLAAVSRRYRNDNKPAIQLRDQERRAKTLRNLEAFKYGIRVHRITSQFLTFCRRN